MQRDVLSVSPKAALLDVHRLFLAEEIHGAPVIDEDDRSLCGMVSATDLLRATLDREELEAPDARCAADIMVPDVVTIAPGASVAEAARVMRERRIHRLVVVENREVVGLLTTFDIIGALVEAEPAPRRTSTGLGRGAGDPMC